METYIDSKKEVDSHLKRTCEEFIHSITQTFVGPLVNFLTKVCYCLLSVVVAMGVLENMTSPYSFEQPVILTFVVKSFLRRLVEYSF